MCITSFPAWIMERSFYEFSDSKRYTALRLRKNEGELKGGSPYGLQVSHM